MRVNVEIVTKAEPLVNFADIKLKKITLHDFFFLVAPHNAQV